MAMDTNILLESTTETITLPDGSTKAATEKQKGTNGEAHVRQVASNVPFPSQLWKPTGAISVSTVASGTVIYNSTDVSGYNYFGIEITSMAGTSPVIKAYASYDGIQYSATPLALINLATGALIAGATGITGVGDYAIAGQLGGGLKFKNLRLIISGGAADLGVTGTGGHGVI